MASRYDNLDARTELEQRIAIDLGAALAPRGCDVHHNGTLTAPAPGGKADIEVRCPGEGPLILVEVTKRTGSAADGEFIAVTDHLDRAVAAGGHHDYLCFFVSPRTSPRMSTNVLDRYNRLRQLDGRRGRVIPVDFDTFESMVDRLVGSDPKLFTPDRFGTLFERWADANDDARTALLIAEVLFEEDVELRAEADERLRQRDAANEQRLRKAIEKMEDRLRDRGVTGDAANVNLIYLTFMRLYEEKRERETGTPSRFTSAGFLEWADGRDAQTKRRHGNRLAEYLLQEIAEDTDLSSAGLLSSPKGRHKELLHNAITDDVVEQLVLRTFDGYRFYGSAVDVLGVVFETLARKSQKDTRVGQFFTPQEVVNFCADLVDLRHTDVVLDPAVGTARFVIAAMERMVATLPPESGPDTETSVRHNQLLGVDLDDWVATIAKMNMYVHGDGKSRMVEGNGLVLADRPVFDDLFPDGIGHAVDVVLTNPPLGDTSYKVALEMWARLGPSRTTERQKAEFLASLGVVPLRDPDAAPEERRARLLRDRIDKRDAELTELRKLPDDPVTRRAIAAKERSKKRALDDLQALLSAPRRDRRPPRAVGERMKGGALFVGAIARYLKPDRLPDELNEWRGGRAAVVVDEAILNTPEYADVRAFIRREFFVKAVISLGRPAFKYLARTDAKTSVLYLVKKADPNHQQAEPVFFAHAEKVGYSATGRWIGSDLPDVLATYRRFQAAVRDSYERRRFRPGTADVALAAVPGRGDLWHARRHPPDPTARLDYFDARYHDLVERMADEGVRVVALGDLIEPRLPSTPEPSPVDEYHFASINRVSGTVSPKGWHTVTYKPTDLWLVAEGDIVVSGIDVVNGAVAVAGADVDGLVMSKEMFPYRVKDGAGVLPQFVALLLRSAAARALVQGKTTGTSNRTRISDPSQLLDLPVPEPPDVAVQRQAVKAFRRAQERRCEADALVAEAEDRAASAWGIDVTPPTPTSHEPDTRVSMGA